jgi:Fe-S cluster biosynthesis and repair protein YggX
MQNDGRKIPMGSVREIPRALRGFPARRPAASEPHGIIRGMARTVHCIKLGKEAEGLDFPPVPGEMGKKLWQSVSKQAWQDWIRQQTMLVNEYRLNLSDPKARKYLAQQMENHFFGNGADTASGYVPPQS